jgi:hypothetical protein
VPKPGILHNNVNSAILRELEICPADFHVSSDVAVAKFSHTCSWCLQVKLDQGLQVLKIFKDHVCKTSILDDFGFYDNREKIMQEKKSRRQYPLEKVC